MEFHAAFYPKQFAKKLDHHSKILLIGSCFTEQIGNKLASHKFNVLENPNGILFNPVSISRAITSYAAGLLYKETDLFYFNELWSSWQHHTRFSTPTKEATISLINDSQEKANAFIHKADWILITLGSAFVYEHTDLENKEVVANCHKVPADKFYHRLLEVQEIKNHLSGMMDTVRTINPNVNFIFTISPVRHLREGFIENNRSKAALIQAVHSLVDDVHSFYFPAYELVIDDLRDYRFFAEDMVHPNYAATNYVWDKFIHACVDEASRQLMKEIAVIVAARNHKPFNPASEQQRKFLQANLAKVERLNQMHPHLDFSAELAYFHKGLLPV